MSRTAQKPARGRRTRLALALTAALAVACQATPASNRVQRDAPASSASAGRRVAVRDGEPKPLATAQPISQATPAPLPALREGGARVVASRRGVVVSVEDNATRAGVRILEAGGNAVDAAVAVAFALAVTHPSAGNLGGGGFLLYHPRGGRTAVVDFREKAPHGVTRERFDAMIARRAVGPAAVGVPGSVAGLGLALVRFGRLPRAQVMAPAIELARKGFRLSRWSAQTIEWAWPDLSRDRAARAIFGERGKPRAAGSVLVQAELAATLARIAEQGDAGFYAGETASAISALAPDGNGVTLADLAAYRAVVREPLVTSYRGYTVELPPPPSAGGVAVAVMLGLLEKLDARRRPVLSADEAHLFAEVARRAHAIRRFEVGDPDSLPGYDLRAKLGGWLDATRVLAAAPPIDEKHATRSASVNPLFDAAMKELEHTTHFAVVDADGNAVSCTTTLSASFGAKVVAAGVVLNDSLAAFGTVGANVLAPDRRMTTSMSPAVVLAQGEPVLVVGSPGGDTIPNTVVRVIRNALDYGMTIQAAVDSPRLHHGFVPDEIRYEGNRPPPANVLAELRRRGHRLSRKSGAIGDANSILITGGVAYGYADPRERGLALGAGESAPGNVGAPPTLVSGP